MNLIEWINGIKENCQLSKIQSYLNLTKGLILATFHAVYKDTRKTPTILPTFFPFLSFTHQTDQGIVNYVPFDLGFTSLQPNESGHV